MSDETEGKLQPIFRPLNADDPEPETTEIESLCMNCEQNGITRLLLTKIPFYKEIVLMSFECKHCGFKNNEIQSGGKIEEKGVKITLNVKCVEDLNRQIVKSDFTSIRIPELEFEIPSRSQSGEITTVEGVLNRSIQSLETSQIKRKEEDPENAEKVELFLIKLRNLRMGKTPFTMIVEDVSGNSFISNPYTPLKDSEVVTTYFVRNQEQNHLLGIFERKEVQEDETIEKDVGVIPSFSTDECSYENLVGEVMQFRTNCSGCGSPCETNMKMTNIPYFKEVVIMATNCEICGHRSNEIKSGGGVEPKGIRIGIKISNSKDLTRDVLKSETCSLRIPEMDVEVGSAALGGRFTTVEGLLTAMKEQLYESGSMFEDSQDTKTKLRLHDFLKQIDDILKGTKSVTLILDDPAGNSYVQKKTETSTDPGLTVTQYERTFEQNEELGLNDIKTENYENDSR